MPPSFLGGDVPHLHLDVSVQLRVERMGELGLRGFLLVKGKGQVDGGDKVTGLEVNLGKNRRYSSLDMQSCDDSLTS